MGLTITIFLPVTAALFWIVILSILAHRTETYLEAVLSMLFTGIFLFSEGCYAIVEEGQLLLDLSILIEQLAAPIIIPLLIIYMQKMLGRNKLKHPLQVLWLMATIAMFTTDTVLFFLRDDPRAVQIYEFCTTTIFKIIIACELVWMGIFAIRARLHTRHLPHNAADYLFRGKPISTVRLQLALLLVPLLIFAVRLLAFPRGMYREGTAIPLTVALLMAIFLFIIGLIALFGTTETVSLRDIRILLRFNYGRESKGHIMEEMFDSLLADTDENSLRRIFEKIGDTLHIDEWKREKPQEEVAGVADKFFRAAAEDRDGDSLLSRFRRLMADEQLYLHPSLTLGDVAERLHTNKTYISKLVNNTYNLGFPELVNTLRVDYAKRYILHHREAKQLEIAEASGFLSASSFNNTFKAVTGVTPKVWIAGLR